MDVNTITLLLVGMKRSAYITWCRAVSASRTVYRYNRARLTVHSSWTFISCCAICWVWNICTFLTIISSIAQTSWCWQTLGTTVRSCITWRTVCEIFTMVVSIVCTIWTREFILILGALWAVVARFAGLWVLNSVRADCAVLNCAITIISNWTRLAARL